MSGATLTITFPSIKTSAFSKSPTLGSRLSTTPPRSRMRRLRPSPTRFWRSAGVAVRSPSSCLVLAGPAEAPEVMLVMLASEASVAPAPVVRNFRRDEGLVDMVGLFTR